MGFAGTTLAGALTLRSRVCLSFGLSSSDFRGILNLAGALGLGPPGSSGSFFFGSFGTFFGGTFGGVFFPSFFIALLLLLLLLLRPRLGLGGGFLGAFLGGDFFPFVRAAAAAAAAAAMGFGGGLNFGFGFSVVACSAVVSVVSVGPFCSDSTGTALSSTADIVLSRVNNSGKHAHSSISHTQTGSKKTHQNSHYDSTPSGPNSGIFGVFCFGGLCPAEGSL